MNVSAPRSSRIAIAALPGHSADTARDEPIALHDTGELLRAALERLPVGVLMVNSDGVLMLVNRELQRLFGYTDGELLGQSVNVLVPDSSHGAHTAAWSTFMEQPQARTMGAGRELFGRRKDGTEFSVEIELTPLRIRDATFVLASVADVTERGNFSKPLADVTEERLEFEALVGELGAEFVNLAFDDVDRRIEDAMGRVVRTLGLESSTMFQVDDSGDFACTHYWTRPGWPPPKSRTFAREMFPWHLEQVRAGQVVSFASPEEVPHATDRESLEKAGVKSAVTIPLIVSGRVLGAVSFATLENNRTWTPTVVNRLSVAALIIANALARRQTDKALRRDVADTESLYDRLRDENLYLRQELKSLTGAPAIVGHSAAMRRLLEQVKQVATTDTPVLLIGETGTGKALLASRIHDLGPRSDRALVRVSCASLSPLWIERQLFGTDGGPSPEPGRQPGRLELASGSTLLLHEVADLPIDTQASLARVLQEQQIRTAGGGPVSLDVRIIATTSADLARCVQKGTFRQDLYNSLAVFPIQVPPLRERREDIPLLVWRFVDEFSTAYSKPVDAFDEESMLALQQYDWPGNARELRNLVERAVLVAVSRRLSIAVAAGGSSAGRGRDTLAAIEREHILAVLAACEGRINGRRGAAARLGLSPRALTAKMAALRIPPHPKTPVRSNANGNGKTHGRSNGGGRPRA